MSFAFFYLEMMTKTQQRKKMISLIFTKAKLMLQQKKLSKNESLYEPLYHLPIVYLIMKSCILSPITSRMGVAQVNKSKTTQIAFNWWSYQRIQ